MKISHYVSAKKVIDTYINKLRLPDTLLQIMPYKDLAELFYEANHDKLMKLCRSEEILQRYALRRFLEKLDIWGDGKS